MMKPVPTPQVNVGKTVSQDRQFKLIRWLNIVTLVICPLAGMFISMPAGADSEKYLLVNPPEHPEMQTQVHTLLSGESTASVAKKYNITISDLRQLNRFRTFAHAFDHLQPGDELDVPASPLPTDTLDVTSRDNARRDEQVQRLAGVTSQAGSFFSNNPNVDTAVSMAGGMASGAAGSEIQTWLSRFGTARVQLDVNKHFSLKNSQFDLLVPLYEQKNNLVFSQGSLHRTDDRTQSNLGLGYRLFTDSWMLGGNTFLDYDLSRDHARMGMGIEFWRDFLKLGMNGYQRLTNWKNSPNVTDYEERPANGWDIRAEAWLPALPQLGGKLIYEQYYGQDVGLFGKDNRQRDPHAITAGINYTPVPLLTFSAEQRQGKSGENDTRFGIDMSYRLGVAWQQQLNPDTVKALRSLTGSRYDLVARNNNIVLEYRKKEIIQLQTADLVMGYAGEQKSLAVSVTSEYGLERVDWEASSLVAAGGKIVQNGADYVVVLPNWNAMVNDVNSYRILGVAVDKKGNISNKSETQVTVQAADVNTVNSTFTPAASLLPADGKSTQILTLTLKDIQKQAIDIPVADISLDPGRLKSATLTALVRKNVGVYETTVTAGTDVEVITLTPAVRGIKLSSAKVSLIMALPVAANSAIKTDQASYTAGSDMGVTVMLKDANNDTVTGSSALLTPDAVKVVNAELKSGSSWQDNNDGSYTATYVAKAVGTNLKATVTLDGWNRAAESAIYAIHGTATLKDISVNGYNFATDAGFPTTGFTGAHFTLNLTSDNGVGVTDYRWVTDAAWVSVTDGVVKFTGTGTRDKVTITGTPIRGTGETITYSFTLRNWYIHAYTKQMTVPEANAYCSNQSGYLPTVEQLNGNTNYSRGTRGTIGAIWSEWGSVRGYPDADFAHIPYWTPEIQRVDSFGTHYYYVAMETGHVFRTTGTLFVICRQDL
ncbi:Invasin [Serratia quinivorans]|uniref:inverse autotransporter beta domain-containing protein n=1 Tax=Serratia quinivorans TaxID=137545 RepID=UPI00217C4093|nr:inverse autotransporter beta domain-containing protein [Serratia quinivorans]CAI1562948.1 Invasin [Serratia quinivorans]